ncbi:phage NrS-1 polymerase family protein [Halorubrum miltondacostae]|uniref:NrS-1 polymerase-like HBD domain-containing protein n=1 Tax=Halorubrum miltondacostae TaxID=3076378 RepID=A0ABD5M5W5_9EURY
MSEPMIGEPEAVPESLRERDQWVCWREEERDGKPTKIPVTPGGGGFASATESETWSSFEAALDYTETAHADGVGFVFTDDDPIVGVDLDDCRDPETGDVDDAALDIIERLDSYTEVSPSGTGYHVLIRGELPDGRNRRGSIELYDTARFFTVTGDHVERTPTCVARRQDALRAIHREYVQETERDTAAESEQRGSADDESPTTGAAAVDVDLEDEDLLEKARNASNGEKFERLWNGNTVGYDSQSEADMALCCLLAFWTGGDRTQMEQLFRQSGLMREKWDEVHYADGSTYGEKTIERAIATTSEFYDPDAGDDVADPHGTPDGVAAGGTPAETDRSRAYLTEKNRLLSERVDELEATLEQKTERIETLEAEIERLTDGLAAREQETTQSHKEESGTGDEAGDDPEPASMLRRFFGGRSE